MYTIISGTNRPNSKTLKVARLYRRHKFQKVLTPACYPWKVSMCWNVTPIT